MDAALAGQARVHGLGQEPLAPGEPSLGLDEVEEQDPGELQQREAPPLLAAKRAGKPSAMASSVALNSRKKRRPTRLAAQRLRCAGGVGQRASPPRRRPAAPGEASAAAPGGRARARGSACPRRRRRRRGGAAGSRAPARPPDGLAPRAAARAGAPAAPAGAGHREPGELARRGPRPRPRPRPSGAREVQRRAPARCSGSCPSAASRPPQRLDRVEAREQRAERGPAPGGESTAHDRQRQRRPAGIIPPRSGAAPAPLDAHRRRPLSCTL